MKEKVFSRIYEVVKNIPKGCVATYGQVALLAGNPRWSRVVGMHFMLIPTPRIFRATGLLTALEKFQKPLFLVAKMRKLHF